MSFFIVFFDHAGLERFENGDFGVTVFFFLSGYLITTLLQAEREKHGTVSLKHFYLRRALRILPPFYVVLLGAMLAAALGLITPARLDAGGAASQLLHYSNYWLATHGYAVVVPGTMVYWSLAVEEHFYLLFPFVFLALAKLTPSKQLAVLLGLCALALAWRCFLVFQLHVAQPRTYLCTDTRYDSILFGAVLAVWRHPGGSDALWKWALLPLGAGALALTLLLRPPGPAQAIWYSVQGLALIPIFVCAMRFPGSVLFRWLNAPLVAFVGTLSYSLYLLHFPVIFAVRTALPGLDWGLCAALSLPISMALAVGIWAGIERPCADLRRRLARV